MESALKAPLHSIEATLRLIRKSTLIVAKKKVIYRLYEKITPSSQFFLQVIRGVEAAWGYVGQDFAQAARLFDMFVRGAITPCTVPDIMNDLAEEFV